MISQFVGEVHQNGGRGGPQANFHSAKQKCYYPLTLSLRRRVNLVGDYNRNGLYLLGGVVLGVVGAALLVQQKGRLRPAAASLLSKGLDVKDQAVTAFEVVKEQTEDLFAEAEDIRSKRSTQELATASSAGDASNA